MTTSTPVSGQCLCGAVKFTATPQKHEYGACHCTMCRRWTAGPFLAVDCGNTVAIEDESALGVYRSSEWAERVFCRTCGTSLFYRLVGSGEYVVSVAALDDTSDFRFTSEIFIDEKPAHYSFANDTRKMTGAEVFAMYVGGEGTADDEKPSHG